MNQKLQNILDIIQQSEKLDAEQKNNLIKAVKDADKELEITAFKLERTEKVKKTTAILLEETIEELEQKRKAVEEQNSELEIEASLERVRAAAMSMNKSEDLLNICEIFFKEFAKLGFNNLRNGLINIFNDEKKILVNYDYSDYMGGSISNVSYNSNPANDEFLIQIRKANDAFVETIIDRDQLDEWKEFRRSHGEEDDPRLDDINALYYYNYSFGSGSIGISNFTPISEKQQLILKRFRNVFNLSYQRYSDIALAEAQTQEAQIEASLERVRAVAMSMNKSDDLLSICEVSFKEFKNLGFDYIRNALIHIQYDEQKYFMDYDFSDLTGGAITKIEYGSHPVVEDYLRQIRSAKDAFYQGVIKEDQLNEWKYFRKNSGQIDDPRLDNATALYYYFFSIGIGDIGISTLQPISESQIKILKRFRNVFDLAYRRYNDITIAEEQARETQIQLALERVRARTMAMHKSNELAETAAVLFQQMTELSVTPERITIGLIKEETKVFEVWSTDQEGIKINHHFNVSLDEPTSGKRIYEAWKEKKKSLIIDLSGQELNDWIRYVREVMGMTIKEELVREHRIHSVAFFSDGMVLTTTPEPLPEESMNLLERFADVFNLTYRRFLDLKQAEAQARESQIQLALERVRARTMAMHNSQDVGATVVTLFDEVLKLGLDKSIRVGIGILEGNEGMETWSATSTPDGKVDLKMGMLDMTIHPMLIGLKKAWESGKTGYSYDYISDDVFRYYEALNNEPDYPFKADLDSLPDNEYHKSFFYTEGILFSFAPNPISDEAAKVLDRFAGVFGQTYRRYLDLQKAEAQAREAKIEASLERVRSKAMAMHSPNDLSETVNVFFKELKALGIIPIRCGVGQIDGETRTTSLTTTTSSQQGESFRVIGKVKQTGHPVLDEIFDHWKLQKEYHPVLEGEDIKAYYDVMNPQIGYPEYPEGLTQYGNIFPFKEGFVFAWTENKLSEEELQIFRRFTTVLSLTYRRYIDLKEAEVRAFDAIKQASLDRVRAEIASMRTSEDLNHITPIIWRELKNLEVPFFRCGVFIVDEDKTEVLVYLTTPDGKSLGVLNLPFESSRLTITTVEFWKQQKVYHEHWNKGEFIKWTKSMMELGQVQNAETYQGSAEPPESLDLHFVPFSQGMLYVGDTSPLNDDKLQLVKILAEAFSIAYARYEDFKHLEEAKARIEVTLSELKSAQAQLVHAEKMASLGELTAGIAHEIKNPLNFVNNFSEVSRELLDEMKVEIQNNNLEEVIELVEDLKQNLEKINTHGKRADSIVKGMLLHSRGTSGEKTLTDINDLLDQYVVLAYHGLRAQDKEFNITIEKDYDGTLEKINVVPQDISRVFLNIVNNACYAANEKKNKSNNDFSPLLKVSTKKLNVKVEIRISDNGYGIPASIKEQIFNPFFTTKPTGEGTGLGLSLSYDIVTKVHGGNIKVESEEGKGAMFIIQLPLS